MRKVLFFAATALATGITVMVAEGLRRRQERQALADELVDLRDDLELNCDLLNSAIEEIPEECVLAADTAFKKVVNDGVEFANTTFPTYAYLDESFIRKLDTNTLNAYLECLTALNTTAEKLIVCVDNARKIMQDAHVSVFGDEK